MSLYELNDLLASYQGLLQADHTIYVSILSAYLVVAYFVGVRLTRLQVIVFSVMFVFAGLLNVGAIAGHINKQEEFQNEILVMSGQDPQSGLNPIPFIYFLGLAFCLFFMWNVRRRGRDQQSGAALK